MQGLVVRKGRLAAEDAQARSAPVTHAVDYFDDADLASVPDMRRAAGAAVHALYFDYAHLAGELFLAAVFHLRQLTRRGQQRPHRHIAPDGAVGLQLRSGQVLVAQLGVEVYGDVLRAHVETYVVAAKEAVYRAGEYVFPRMSLHPSKAERPVELSLDQRARLQRLRDEVDNVLPLLTQAEEIEARELTLVRLLTPAAGEKRRPVELYGPALLIPCTGEHAGSEAGEMAVLVIQFFSQVLHLLYY